MGEAMRLHFEETGFRRVRIDMRVEPAGIVFSGTQSSKIGGKWGASEWSILVPETCFSDLSRGLGEGTAASEGQALSAAIAARFSPAMSAFDALHGLIVAHGGTWRRLRFQKSGDAADDAAYGSADIPRAGDGVYIPSALHVSHGVDDYVGGLTTVASVKVGMPADVYVWVSLAFSEAGECRWDVLKAQQGRLAEAFGDQPPRATPDYRGEFNRFDE